MAREMTPEERAKAETGFGFGRPGDREFGARAEASDLLGPYGALEVVEHLRAEAARIMATQRALVSEGLLVEVEPSKKRLAGGLDMAAVIIEGLVETENWPAVVDALSRMRKGWGPR